VLPKINGKLSHTYDRDRRTSIANLTQAASCKGEGFKRVIKLRKEGMKGLEKFEVGKVGSWKSSKLEKCEVGKVRRWKSSMLEKCEVGKVRSWKRSKLEKLEVGKVRSWKS